MNIYVASSWRNCYQERVVEFLRSEGYEVYDFKHPAPGDDGFGWREIDPTWQSWSPTTFRHALSEPPAVRGFAYDSKALKACDVCVLVLPSGRSAHLEAGYAAGAGKPVIVFIPEQVEPELMYKLAWRIVVDAQELIAAVKDCAEAR